MKKSEYEKARQEVLCLYDRAGIVLREDEKEELEVADFGLGVTNISGWPA